MRGTVVRDQHYPGRAPIDAYGNGGFRFAGMSHRGSLLLLPSGIHGWAARTAGEIDRAALARAFEEAAGIEVLLLGAGPDPWLLPDDLRAAFREARISADAMTTGAAVRTYNVLLAEDRRVAAALIAVD
jgi:uncharacterized protein